LGRLIHVVYQDVQIARPVTQFTKLVEEGKNWILRPRG
jgi:hypothetical protein